MTTETWTEDGERFVVIDYDERGVAEVTREAMRGLLEKAGFVQAEIPAQPQGDEETR